MGQVILPLSGSIYVDTNAVIYAVEQIEPYHTAAAPLWDALNVGQIQVITSELTLLECLVKPLRLKNQDLVDLYRRVLLGTTGLSCVPIQRSTLESAAQARALLNLRTPDAIHAATAQECSCVMFLTNDAAYRKVPSLHVAVLSEIAASGSP